MSNLIGKQLGDYTLVGVLATGGMARIYEGVDRRLGRQAAVKVLELHQGETPEDEEVLPLRFQREARAVAQLEHDNIITIYQYGEQDGLYFIAMKLVRGRDLAQELARLRRNGLRMDVRRGLRILEQVASALDCAHEAQIVHRDVKPSNVLLDANDRATLTDFGLVMQQSFDSTLGTAFGTPRYIAPEQALNSGSAVAQSDIYSLGVILFEVLTGQTPFDGSTPMEIALSQINDPPPPPRSLNESIPEAAEREMLRALEKEPTKRQSTATELIAAVKRAYDPDGDASTELAIKTTLMPETPAPPIKTQPSPSPLPRSRRPFLLGGAAAAVVAVIAIALVLLTSRTPPLSGTNGTKTSPNTAGSVALGKSTPTLAATIAPTETPIPKVQLSYTNTTFYLINSTASDLNVSSLQFAHGSNVFAGSSIPRGNIPPGTCYRIQLERAQSSLPTGCGRIYVASILPNSHSFFWLSAPDNDISFEVRLNGSVISTCPTIDRSAATCSFTLPPSS